MSDTKKDSKKVKALSAIVRDSKTSNCGCGCGCAPEIKKK